MAIDVRAGAPVDPADDHAVVESASSASTLLSRSSVQRWLSGAWRAPFLLLIVLCGLAVANDSHGYLGTDTGGKMATIEAMNQRGDLDVDIGYWAEQWDPEGTLHPYWYTQHIGDKWVNVTTVPALVPAVSLYDLGGYRAVLLLPMLGAIAAALAARRLARRVGCSSTCAVNGSLAFWMVGLAGPLAIYALDFWEHSLGVAALMWAVVLALAAVDRKAPSAQIRFALASGACIGLGASMRTESLVYGAVLAAVVCVTQLIGRRVWSSIRIGIGVLGGLIPMVLLNRALESAMIGSGLRASRASGTAQVGGRNLPLRMKEALITTFGLNVTDLASDIAIGAGLALGIWLLVRASRRGVEWRPKKIVTVSTGMLALVVILVGPRFIPGMLIVAPFAVAALSVRPQGAARLLIAIAVVALPLVWWFQYTGGALPQWGGRYVLVSSTLLIVVGTTVAMSMRVRTALVLGSLIVTGLGLLWLSERSHDVASAIETIEGQHHEVVVSGIAHFARESGGLIQNHGTRWLTAVDDETRAQAAAVVVKAGLHEFGLVMLDRGQTPPEQIGGFTRMESTSLVFIQDVRVLVTSYRREG